ncbi:MAG: xanthine dehydrogenase family protein subunit M [Deltaproteobacteria bacterium]|nr:xanthine dehydrogenase family protein subunit M [Deltaproteobacteria bacterium]
MKKFDYLKPNTLEEALSLLNQYGDRAKMIAGGTDAIVMNRQKKISPDVFISLRGIPGLDQIEFNGIFKIGALVTHRTIEQSELIRKRFPILAGASSVLGSVQVRNVATIGGNLCTASPSAETSPSLLVYEAEAHLVSQNGERRLSLESFFVGPGENALDKKEILKGILLPSPPPNSVGAYLKLGRRKSVDLSVVNVAVLLTLDPKTGICERARIALGAVAPTPLRAKETEKILEGNLLDDGIIRKAGDCAKQECSPITDIRGSAEYRREMAGVLVEKGIRQSLVNHSRIV